MKRLAAFTLSSLSFVVSARAAEVCIVYVHPSPEIICTDKNAETIKLPTYKEAGRDLAVQTAESIKILETNGYQFRTGCSRTLYFVKK